MNFWDLVVSFLIWCLVIFMMLSPVLLAYALIWAREAEDRRQRAEFRKEEAARHAKMATDPRFWIWYDRLDTRPGPYWAEQTAKHGRPTEELK